MNTTMIRNLLTEMGHRIHELEPLIWFVTKGAEGITIEIQSERRWKKLDSIMLPIEYQLENQTFDKYPS